MRRVISGSADGCLELQAVLWHLLTEMKSSRVVSRRLYFHRRSKATLMARVICSSLSVSSSRIGVHKSLVSFSVRFRQRKRHPSRQARIGGVDSRTELNL